MLHLLLEWFPVDITGHGDNGSIGAKESFVLGLDRIDAHSFDIFQFTAAILIPGWWIVPSPELDFHLLLRCIFESLDVLNRQGLDGLQFLFGQVWAQDDIGIKIQGSGNIAVQRRTPELHVDAANALAAIDAKPIESE